MDTTPFTAPLGSRKGRPNYPTDFKLRLAQQACEPGGLVSRLACEHGINANLLFKWRSHYMTWWMIWCVSVTPLPSLIFRRLVLEVHRGRGWEHCAGHQEGGYPCRQFTRKRPRLRPATDAIDRPRSKVADRQPD